MQNALKSLCKTFPRYQDNLRLAAFKATTPMLLFSGPKVLRVDVQETVIRMPLKWFNSNSWGTMFFASIAAGIDLCGGFYSFVEAEKSNLGVLYKDVNIEFKRRVDGDLTLVALSNSAIKEACNRAVCSGKRVNVPIRVEGYCYETFGKDNPVVSASATLSIKRLAKQG